jgi:hypothetical protein
MKSQQLDMKISFSDGGVRLNFRGIFFHENWASIQEKIDSFAHEGIKLFVCQMDHVEFRDSHILQEFLDIHNTLNGRKARLIFIVQREASLQFFTPYKHIFEIYPTYDNFRKQGFVRALRKVGVAYSKKTGIRISPTTAALVMLLLTGWVLTLLSMIQNQSDDIEGSSQQVRQLSIQKQELNTQIRKLETKLAPLKHLGLLSDSLDQVDYQPTSDWVDHLKKKDERRQRKLKANKK